MPPESQSAPPLLSSSLGIALLTRAWLFQAIIATPIALILGFCALGAVYDGYYTKIYDFVMYLGNTILAGAIIFIVLVQRQLKPDDTLLRTAQGKKLTFLFEIAKSVLATALWLWILLDAIFNPHRYYYDDEARMRRILCCLIAYVVLIIFWYPTVWYSHYSMITHSDEGEEDGTRGAAEEEGERAPLLGNETV